MMTLTKIVLIIALILSIVIFFGAFLIGERSKGRYKTKLMFSNCYRSLSMTFASPRKILYHNK